MSVILIGLSHHTAPLGIRERAAFEADDVQAALLLFAARYPEAEAAILSTCNRVELIIGDPSGQLGADRAVQFFAQCRELPVNSIAPYLYRLVGEEAVRHLLRVAGGLDSMVVGECHIVNQIKHAYAVACEHGTARTVLNRLFHLAFAVGKRLRSETRIGSGKTSLCSAAVERVRQSLPDMAAVRALVVGAGEMAQDACRCLRQAGTGRLTLASRSFAHARALAESFQAQALPLERLDEALSEANVIFTATSGGQALLTVERMRRARARASGPLVVIDLAVPRNVEVGVGSLPGVHLHDVDTLGELLQQHRRHRLGQVELCEQIIAEEVEAFQDWLDMTLVKPLIEMMYAAADRLKEAELQRLLRRCPDLSEQQKACVDQLAQRLISKFMHPCVSTLRQHRLSTPAATLAQSFHAAAAARQDPRLAEEQQNTAAAERQGPPQHPPEAPARRLPGPAA